MGVTVLEPAGTTISTDQLFSYESDDGDYCWENFLTVSDSTGSVVYDSGLFNPNNVVSSVQVNNLDASLGPYAVVFHCNPTDVTEQTFDIQSISEGDVVGGAGVLDPSALPVTSPFDADSVSEVNVILDPSELESVFGSMLTEFQPQLFSLILTGAFTSMVIGLGGGWLYKAIKSR